MIISSLVINVLSPLESEPVRPAAGQGFAATVIVAFVVIGLLALIMIFISSKPKNRRPRR